MIKLLFTGDIMPGGVLPYQNEFITTELLDYMRGFDFRIGTLEAAIGTGLTFDPVKMAKRQNIIYARNQDFLRVKEMGFDLVSLANNHVWDLGEDGLHNTIGLLRDNGILYCGAGINAEEASRPAVITKEGLSIAIFAYCMYGNKYLGHVELAKDDKAGVNPLNIEKVIQDIRNAKKKYDKVIVMPHWGREYRYEPMHECVSMAKRMVKAGADAVLGSHTHQIQPLIWYKGKIVCFSMGNFMFPDFYMIPPRPIWYPDSLEDVRDVVDVVGYPFPIEKPIRQVWNPISRFGCVVALEIDSQAIKATCRYVHLSKDNVESLVEPNEEMLVQLHKASLMITNTSYRTLILAKRKAHKFLGGMYHRYKGV